MSGNAASSLFSFETAAAELRRQEFARLADTVPPTLARLRSLIPAAFRAEVALMLERLGYSIVTDPSAEPLIVTKDQRKFVVACAPPTARGPTRTPELARLHDAIIAANAESGFYVTARTFSPAAEAYAATAPIKLVDQIQLAASMRRSRADAVLSESYKAMCPLCGALVQHRLDNAAALPCPNGHPVAPTIARAALVPYEGPSDDVEEPRRRRGLRPDMAMSPKSRIRGQIKAHNKEVRNRAIRQRPEAK